jgi:hypothetical protein
VALVNREIAVQFQVELDEDPVTGKPESKRKQIEIA